MGAGRLGSLGMFGFLLLLTGGATASAQLPISLSARTGETKVTSGGSSGARGWSFDLVAAYRISPRLSAYLMSGATELGAHRDVESVDLSVYATSAGVSMLVGPLDPGLPAPWVRAGAGTYSLSANRETPRIDERSRARLGFDLGAGIAIPLSPQWHVTPAVRFAWFTPDIRFQEIVGSDTVVSYGVEEVSYLTVDIGLTYSFGIRRGR